MSLFDHLANLNRPKPMQYSLTDFTARELSSLIANNEEAINISIGLIEAIESRSPEYQHMMNRSLIKNRHELATFRQMGVILHTALQIVKDREKVFNS